MHQRWCILRREAGKRRVKYMYKHKARGGWTADCAQLGLGAEQIHLRWIREVYDPGVQPIDYQSLVYMYNQVHVLV